MELVTRCWGGFFLQWWGLRKVAKTRQKQVHRPLFCAVQTNCWKKKPRLLPHQTDDKFSIFMATIKILWLHNCRSETALFNMELLNLRSESIHLSSSVVVAKKEKFSTSSACSGSDFGIDLTVRGNQLTSSLSKKIVQLK